MANAQDQQLDRYNDQWRSSPDYAEILASIGVDPSKPIKLSKDQRHIVQSALEQKAGKAFDKGLEIDAAGNMNQKEGFTHELKKWGPLAGGIALTLFGIPGVMPGVLGIGGAGAAGAAGAASAAGGAGSAATAAGTVGAGMSVWDKVKGFIPKVIGPVGSLLTGASQAAADNRGTQIDIGMETNKLNQQAYTNWYQEMLAREQEGRAGRNDSWKALQQGDYTANMQPTTTGFSPYTRPLTPPSDAVRAAGAARATDAGTRLTGYQMPTPERQTYTTDPKLLTPGAWEKLAGYGGLAMQGVSPFFANGAPTSTPQVQPRQPQPMPFTPVTPTSFANPNMIGGQDWLDQMQRRPLY